MFTTVSLQRLAYRLQYSLHEAILLLCDHDFFKVRLQRVDIGLNFGDLLVHHPIPNLANKLAHLLHTFSMFLVLCAYVAGVVAFVFADRDGEIAFGCRAAAIVTVRWGVQRVRLTQVQATRHLRCHNLLLGLIPRLLVFPIAMFAFRFFVSFLSRGFC